MQCDVLVIGCGAAGVQAAIHAARKKVKVIIIGKPENSALSRAHIENYFGVRSITGDEILKVGIEQAESFGAQLVQEEVIELKKVDEGFMVHTDALKEFVGKALIFAMGISRNKLNVEGEKEYHGLGVSYCANCDCHFFKKKTVAVVGDGSSAVMAALLLADYASKVHLISKGLKASPEITEKLRSSTVNVIENAWPSKILGDDVVKALELKDGRKLDVDGVFIELGAKGAADLAVELGILPDENDSLLVDKDCKTEAEGVYACGDITGQPWQLAKAVGQGCVAGLNAASYVRKDKE